MRLFRLLTLLVASLIFQITPVFAESVKNATDNGALNSSGVKPAISEVWGDPEEEESESVWTWFGMGYELRNKRNSASQVAPDVNNSSDTSIGAGGRAQQRK